MSVESSERASCVERADPGSAETKNRERTGVRGAHARSSGEPIDGRKIALARWRRRNPTPSEQRAWQLVRDRRLLGLKFRREQIIDGFLIDLYCHQLGLCIEIDGGVHDDPAQAESDAIRTTILEARGLRIVRIRSHAVSRETLEALVRPLKPLRSDPPDK